MSSLTLECSSNTGSIDPATHVFFYIFTRTKATVSQYSEWLAGAKCWATSLTKNRESLEEAVALLSFGGEKLQCWWYIFVGPEHNFPLFWTGINLPKTNCWIEGLEKLCYNCTFSQARWCIYTSTIPPWWMEWMENVSESHLGCWNHRKNKPTEAGGLRRWCAQGQAPIKSTCSNDQKGKNTQCSEDAIVW